jgi:hypothetical protein
MDITQILGMMDIYLKFFENCKRFSFSLLNPHDPSFFFRLQMSIEQRQLPRALLRSVPLFENA